MSHSTSYEERRFYTQTKISRNVGNKSERTNLCRDYANSCCQLALRYKLYINRRKAFLELSLVDRV